MKKYLLLAFPFAVMAQENQSPDQFSGKEPLMFMDSVAIGKNQLKDIDNETIASVSVYKDESALKMHGDKGKDGVIYIESKGFSMKRYQRFFSSKSSDYKKSLIGKHNDSHIQYIFNGSPVTKDFEGDLATVDNVTFKSIRKVSKSDLVKKYNITDKEVGFEIVADLKVVNPPSANNKK